MNIGEAAFLGASIQSAYIGKNLTAISYAAFAYSQINNLVYDSAIDLAEYLFYRSKIENYQFIGGFEKVGNASFYDAEIIGDFILPQSVKEIGQLSFSKSLLEKIILPSSLEIIGVAACADMPKLLYINIPNLIKYIPNLMLANCISLTQIDIQGNLLVKIGESAFKNISITSIYLPESLDTIEKFAFSGSLINSIRLSAWISELNFSVFENCINLSKIIIPKNSLEISFYNPDYLSYKTFKGFEVESGNKYFSTCGDIHLYSIDGSKLEVLIDCESYVAPKSLKQILPYQFSNKFSLYSVVLSEGLESIGMYAFAGSKTAKMNIKIIDFSKAINLTTIQLGAFCYNQGLLKVDLTACNSIKYLSGFSNCISLDSVILSGGFIGEIGIRLFIIV